MIRALSRLRDCYDPRTTSLMVLAGRCTDPHAEPFRKGFIAHFEERAEVVRRLADLQERERKLLLLWHVESRPVAHIARILGMSRVHCYRVQRRALEAMLDRADEGAELPAVATA